MGLAKEVKDAYEARIEALTRENEYLRKQIAHLQASIDAELGCEGTTYDDEEEN